MFLRNQKRISLDLAPDSTLSVSETAPSVAMDQDTPKLGDRVNQYYEQLREPIFRYLMSSFGGERHQAEEITQDVFVEMYRVLKQGQSIEQPRAWAYRVAHNKALTHLKRQQFIAPLSEDEWAEVYRSLEATDLNPEQLLLRREKLERLRRALGRLTLIERECLNLRTKGFRHREIGEILDITTKSVSATIYRVIDKLAKESNG